MDDSLQPSVEALLDHAGWVRALARTLVRDANEADDLAQETLTAALSARPAAGSGFKAWLATTLGNVKRQRWRRNVARERFEALYAREQARDSSEDLAEQADLQRALVAHVLALDEPYRGVLLQRYFAARTPSEIAARSSVPVATVTSQLTRAHEKLRRRLEQQQGGGGSWLSAVVPLLPRARVASIAGGILLSTKIALSAAAAVIVALVVWATLSREPVRAPLSPVTKASEVSLESSPGADEKAGAALAAAATEVARATAKVSGASAAAAHPDECVVLGRVTDENDHPLPGVAVRLAAVAFWAEGIAVPRLAGRWDMHGFEITTGEDGRFRFAVPMPTKDRALLTIEPDPFRDSSEVWLGGRNPGARAPLHAGENEMGTFPLAPTGAIRGSVHDEAGAPIADALLLLGPDRSHSFDREASSDAAGNYVLGHAPAGPMGLHVEAEGFLSEFKKPIDVQLGRFCDHVDFVLKKAPTLSGIVVDENDRPVEGVKLTGFPRSGTGAAAWSRADGTFTMFLPQDEPYTIEAARDGYEPIESGAAHDPNAHDLRLVMKRLAPSTLLVLDARTKQPVTVYGIEVIPGLSRHLENPPWTAIRSPLSAPHPDGKTSVAFRPGVDVVDVGARGYQSQRFDPDNEPPRDGRFVVELTPAVHVSGLVRIDKVPAGGVNLKLERGSMRDDDFGAFSAQVDRRTRVHQHFHVDHQQGTMSTISAEDGSFDFTDLLEGTYRLFARTADGHAALVAPFDVSIDASVDLGILELQPGASVNGVVLVPAGRRAAGLKLYVDDAGYGEAQVTDADGRFRFEGLAAGPHQIFLPESAGSIGVVAPVDVMLAPGEVREVTFDARNAGTCTMDLTILIGGAPAASAQVTLVRPDGQEFARLGTTDERGHVMSSVPLGKDLTLRLWNSEGLMFRHPSARFDLVLDAKIVETIRFETGSLAVVIPESLVLPVKWNARLQLMLPGESKTAAQDRWVTVHDVPVDNLQVTASDRGHRLQFDGVIAGEWDLLFDISDEADPRETVQIGPRHWEGHRKTMFNARASVKVDSGKTASVVLR